MSELIPALSHAATIPVVVDLLGADASSEDSLASECLTILRDRGLQVSTQTLQKIPHGSSVVAVLLSAPPNAVETNALADQIAEHAKQAQPCVVYHPPSSAGSGREEEVAACIASLRSRGAIVTTSPEIWVECIVLLSAYGCPSGPQIAIVAPPGSWIEAAVAGQQKRAERLGERFLPSHASPESSLGTDIVLTSPAVAASIEPAANRLVIPIAGYPGYCSERPVLVHLNTALQAAVLCGQACLRIASGDGPALSPFAGQDVDDQRFERQLSKLQSVAGDHECKVLLSSYGISITRQAVATTPSAATRIAKKAGYPVQIKAWGPEQASETDGALVLRDIESASEVRRAFASICSAEQCEAVIIRETPMAGRELAISIRPDTNLGLLVYLRQSGHTSAVAALAPLREIDSLAMAHNVAAGRLSDESPDWDALSDLLIRASHLVADNPEVSSLELYRVSLGQTGEGAVVIDAKAILDNSE